MLERFISHKRFSLYYFIFLSVVIFLSTTYIWYVLYWNDEWRSLASILVLGVSFAPAQVGDLLLRGRLFGLFFFSRLLQVSLYQPYRIISLMLIGHIVNSFLIFSILKRATKNIVFSVTASIFFAVSSTNAENFFWLGAGFYDILSMTFALLTLLFLQTMSLNRNRIFALFAIIATIIAYEWKESCAFLFLFVPAYFFVIKNEWTRRTIIVFITVFSFVATLLGIISYRYLSSIGFLQGGHVGYTIARISFNLLFYPLMNLSQFIIPDLWIGYIRFLLFHIPESIFAPVTTYLGVSANLLLFDSLSILGSIIVIAILYRMYKLYPHLKKIILIGLLWYMFSMSPIAVRLITRSNGYLRYSYLYHPLFAVSIFFSCVVTFLADVLKKKTFMPVLQILVVFYFMVQFYFGYYISHTHVVFYIREKTFISLFQPYIQKLPNKPIVYINSPMHFSVATSTARLPFMLGSGFIISVLSYPSGVIPPNALTSRYLEPFDSQGYMVQGNKGYGFYWNFDDLQREFKTHRDLSVTQVIALDYSADSMHLTDISDSVREQLQKDRTNTTP